MEVAGTVLTIRGLTQRYGKGARAALDCVDLAVPKGQVTALKWDRAALILLVIVALVLVGEAVSAQVRRAVT